MALGIPFSEEQFLNVLSSFNNEFIIGSVLLFIGALLIVYLLFAKSYSRKLANLVILLFTAFLWLWTGIFYHLVYFTSINKAAFGFGALFIIQAGLLVFVALKKKADFTFRNNLYSITGLIFIFFALILYPLLGLLFGQVYPAIPLFPLPCPLMIFTFGLLLIAKNTPKYLLIIPFIWAIIGTSAAFAFSIYQDISLIIAAILGTVFIFVKDKT